MSEIVFVLGAGASSHCGTPLMGNFLEVAEGLWRRGEVREVEEDFKRVFDAIGNLQGIHSKAKLDTYNVETIYAAFEMGKLLGSLPSIGGSSEADALMSSIKTVIGYTLERTTRLPGTSAGGPMPPTAYSSFAKVVSDLISKGRRCSVMTFNYDLGLDYALYRNKVLVDYALGGATPQGKLLTYLKLHGSLNWVQCEKCGKILDYREFQYTESRADLNYSVIPVISRLNRLRCCGGELRQDPFIVPPTWNKTAFHTAIEQVWQRAARELKDAENIFVLGYSLPPTDLFFNYLFALGVDMRTVLKKFYVYDIDQSGGVEQRFRDLLGSGVMQRFVYQWGSFEMAVGAERFPDVTTPITLPVGLRDALFRG